MTIFSFYNVTTTLASAITSGATSIDVSSSSGLPSSVPSGTVIALGIGNATGTTPQFEIVYVTAISGTTLTIERGQEGTTAQAFASGSYVNSITSAGQQASFVQTGPAFSAIQTSSQSIPNVTYTQVEFQSTEFDTNSNYDISTNTFTPTVPGYYLFTASINFSSPVSPNTLITFYKNGSEFKRGNQLNASLYGITASALIHCNGTDAITVYCYQSAGSAQDTAGSSTNCYFQGVLVREG